MVEVIFYKGNDILSKAIKFVTQDEYSHCGYIIYKTLVIDIDAIHGLRIRVMPWKLEDVDVLPSKHNIYTLINKLYDSKYTRYSIIECFRKIIPFIKDDYFKVNCAEMVYDIEELGNENVSVYPSDVYKIIKQKVVLPMENTQPTQHVCNMTEVINDIKAEQVEQKISLVTLSSEVTRLVSAVADLVDTQKKEVNYKLSQKDKKIDSITDIVKSIFLLLAGFLLSLI